jgi:Family of unknown function (DUF5681)
MTAKPDEPHDPTDMSHRLYDSAKDPSSPFYEGNKSDAEQKSDLADEDSYKIGPGFPPNEHKWKEGCPSPNPKGRPRKIPSMKPDLKKAFEAALNEKVVITKDKKEIVLTKAALGIQQLVNQFAKGDRHARRDLFQYAALLGVDLQAKDVVAEALGITDQAIVEDYVRRRQQLSAEPAPDDHVKAPPDLIDDDVTKSEPNEMPTDSPQPDTPAKKLAEPVLDEHGKPLPVSDPRYVRAMRERNIAQQKKNQGGS